MKRRPFVRRTASRRAMSSAELLMSMSVLVAAAWAFFKIAVMTIYSYGRIVAYLTLWPML